MRTDCCEGRAEVGSTNTININAKSQCELSAREAGEGGTRERLIDTSDHQRADVKWDSDEK